MQGVNEMQSRLNAAQGLAEQGRYDEAAVEFEWLWNNMTCIDPAMSGVRISFMAKYIEDLVRKHAPTRQRFSDIRDRTAMLAGADIASTGRLRFDWIVLNEILSDSERTLTWFDTVKDDERYSAVLDLVAPRLVPLLKSHNRFRDIGRIYKDPVATFVKTSQNLAPPQIVDPDHPDPRLSPDLQRVMGQALQTIRARLPKHVIEQASLIVTCLLAAGRIAEADAVEREARRLDPSEAMRAALQKAREKLD